MSDLLDKIKAASVEFDQFLNEPPPYENERMVRGYRHEAYAKWQKLSLLITDVVWQAERSEAEKAGHTEAISAAARLIEQNKKLRELLTRSNNAVCGVLSDIEGWIPGLGDQVSDDRMKQLDQCAARYDAYYDILYVECRT
jgi:hypothetical protein